MTNYILTVVNIILGIFNLTQFANGGDAFDLVIGVMCIAVGFFCATIQLVTDMVRR